MSAFALSMFFGCMFPLLLDPYTGTSSIALCLFPSVSSLPPFPPFLSPLSPVPDPPFPRPSKRGPAAASRVKARSCSAAVRVAQRARFLFWGARCCFDIILHHITLHNTTLHCTTLHYTTLHHITLHYTTLAYIALLQHFLNFVSFVKHFW